MSSGKPLSKMHQRLNQATDTREKLGKSNTFWDDAAHMYQSSIQAIDTTHGTLALFLKEIIADPARLAMITDAQTLISNNNLLTRDIGEHVEHLNAIYETHKDKKGSSTDPDDHMLLLKVNGQYHDAIDVYNTTIMPTVTHIFEQIGVIEQLIAQEEMKKKEVEARRLADPRHISDVVVKEVKEA